MFTIFMKQSLFIFTTTNNCCFFLNGKHKIYSWTTTFHIYHQNPDKGSYPPFNSFRITEPYFLRSCVCKSVEGLILISGPDGLVIWNPTSQRFSTIPHPSEKYAGTINQNCYVLFRIRSVGGYVNPKFSAKNLTNIPRRCEFLHWENC